MMILHHDCVMVKEHDVSTIAQALPLEGHSVFCIIGFAPSTFFFVAEGVGTVIAQVCVFRSKFYVEFADGCIF